MHGAPRSPARHVASSLAACLAVSSLVSPQGAEEDFPDYATLPLEELMTIELEATSASRRPRAVSDTAAAVYVITAEDLARSGATSLVDALRLAPGVQVAQVSSNTWAVSARGFNDTFSNKLLVMMDGRALYSPIFAGTFWDVQDYPLGDIERIEVVRGPGATLWGANAVNGVINIITKSARETHGLALAALAGSRESVGTLRYGLALDDGGDLRVYGKVLGRDDLVHVGGVSNADEWDQGRAGFRGDWGVEDRLTLQGDAYSGNGGNVFDLASASAPPTAPVAVDSEVRGGNLLARWTRTFDSDQSFSLQAYFDRTERNYPDFLSEDRSTLDLDFQQESALGDGALIYGLGARHSVASITRSPLLSFDDEQRDDTLISAFAQLEWALGERSLMLVGTKLEQNDVTGFEIQPTVRGVWHVSEEQSVWLAASRAVRTPSHGEEDVTLIAGILPGAGSDTLLVLKGNDPEAESLWAYEAGWRRELGPRLALDLAVFFNTYDDLITFEPGDPIVNGSGDTVLPFLTQNLGEANTYGAELAGTWVPAERWELAGSYSFLSLDYDVESGSADPLTQEEIEGSSPAHQARLSASWLVHPDLRLNAELAWVDDLDHGDVSSYTRGTLGAEWSLCDAARLRVFAQNLLHDGEREFGSTLLQANGVEVESAFYAELRIGN
jgi:iron complex outermembrane receptor protein